MIRVVFDTNVFVSALLTPHSPPGRLLELALQGKMRLLISPQLLEEIERVLDYPKVKKVLQLRKISHREIDEAVAKILRVAVLTPGKMTVSVIADDPADDKILAGAVEGQANFIITGDHHLLDLNIYQGIRIMSPTEFLKVLESQESLHP